MKPKVLCEVAFNESTGNARLRHSKFLRLRDQQTKVGEQQITTDELKTTVAQQQKQIEVSERVELSAPLTCP